MNFLEAALLPLAAFWAAFTAMLEGAKFTNEMRETIISGTKNGTPLTLKHRRGMFFDWRLTMVGIVSGTFTFGGLAIWASRFIPKSENVAMVSSALYAVGGIIIFGGLLFICCGLSDAKLMTEVLEAPGETKSDA